MIKISKLENHLQKRMVWGSKECHLHTYVKDGLERVKPIKMMLVEGKEVCPRCTTQGWTRELEKKIGDKYRQYQVNYKSNMFVTKSIVSDKSLLKSSFERFMDKTTEEAQNKKMCMELLGRLKEGEVFNILLQGCQGAGKSHLAYSLLKEMNKTSEWTCLFICVDEMMRLIRASFGDAESKYTEHYFIELLSSADFLVLDDLGAETGAIDTSKRATDFVQRVLYSVMNARQDKVTIITTNLDSRTLFAVYDKKLISRLLKNPQYVLFKDTLDKRMAGLPF